ncbi:unnamed protein product [Sphagnum jensenii]|uniref:Uncharacterized protein n=1 Tax=Sphagnum jensenii TaxID=128206 RepID=A0ABP0X1R1_9BRYO
MTAVLETNRNLQQQLSSENNSESDQDYCSTLQYISDADLEDCCSESDPVSCSSCELTPYGSVGDDGEEQGPCLMPDEEPQDHLFSSNNNGSRHTNEATAEGAQLSMVALLLATVRKSLLTCQAGPQKKKQEVEGELPPGEDSQHLRRFSKAAKEMDMAIGWPTDVEHVAHVTFDRYNGFLGLPEEYENEVPRPTPSASQNVFGVSAESMQCSYDLQGNMVPTILLLLQKRLYDQGGLKAEGIFRINPENSHEDYVREQLNKGIVPTDIDIHALAGLIKAWFRELPKGVLDALSPDAVLGCHGDKDSLALIKNLPPTEAALLDWAVNLMADVVEEEASNKMNARNIAMVFAPNMTQMSDPLTALMHAVQVMNLLKTLIIHTLRQRQAAQAETTLPLSSPEVPKAQEPKFEHKATLFVHHEECRVKDFGDNFFNCLDQHKSQPSSLVGHDCNSSQTSFPVAHDWHSSQSSQFGFIGAHDQHSSQISHAGFLGAHDRHSSQSSQASLLGAHDRHSSQSSQTGFLGAAHDQHSSQSSQVGFLGAHDRQSSQSSRTPFLNGHGHQQNIQGGADSQQEYNPYMLFTPTHSRKVQTPVGGPQSSTMEQHNERVEAW